MRRGATVALGLKPIHHSWRRCMRIEIIRQRSAGSIDRVVRVRSHAENSFILVRSSDLVPPTDVSRKQQQSLRPRTYHGYKHHRDKRVLRRRGRRSEIRLQRIFQREIGRRCLTSQNQSQRRIGPTDRIKCHRLHSLVSTAAPKITGENQARLPRQRRVYQRDVTYAFWRSRQGDIHTLKSIRG